jgi:hypothetical protein
LYDSGFLFFSLEAGDEDNPEQHWFHLSYGNLQSFRFAVLQLDLAGSDSRRTRAAVALGTIPLRVPASGRLGSFMNMWQVFKKLDLNKPWVIKFWEAYRGSAHVLDNLNPGIVAVVGVLPNMDGRIVPVKVGPRGKKQTVGGAVANRGAGVRRDAVVLALQDRMPHASSQCTSFLTEVLRDHPCNIGSNVM